MFLKTIRDFLFKPKPYQKETLEYLQRIEEKVDSILGIKYKDAEYQDLGDMVFTYEGSEVFDGVYCQKLKIPEDVGGTLIMVKVEADKFFPEHYHIEDEYVFMLEGELVDTVNNKTYKAGERIFWESMEVHAVKTTQPANYLVFWRPKLTERNRKSNKL